jgi:hypothetical protein
MKISSARNFVMFDFTGLSFLAHVAERHRREREAQMISGPQIRTARGFLGWTVARKAVVGINTVQKIESGEVAASLAELVAIQATLAAEGIEFTDDGVPGVRLHKKKRQK